MRMNDENQRDRRSTSKTSSKFKGSLTDGSDRATQILDGAAELFVEKGFDQTSVRDVADAAGLLPGSLYYYLEKKEDLLYGVLIRQHEALLALLGGPSDEDQPIRNRLRRFIDRHLDFELSPIGRSVAYQFEVRTLTPEQQATIRGYRQRYEEALMLLLEIGQAESVVCPDIEVRAGSRVLLSLLNSLQRWQLQEGARKVVTPQIRAVYSDMALAGILCDPSIHRPGHRTAEGR